MENLRDLQAQARSLERSGQHAAALELYGRILEEPAGDREGGVWVRAARLQLGLGQEARAAGSYAAAADRYQAAGLGNLALAQCQQSLRIEAAAPEMLLRFGRLAAAQGYARDARHGFVEYADQASAAGESSAATAALREYLERFPGDAAVRRRLSELAGERPAPPSPLPPEPAPAEPASTEPLPGLIPTHVETVADQAAPAAPEGEESAPEQAHLDEEGEGVAEVGPLEGFEPTHAEEAYEAAPPIPVDAPAELDHGRWSPESVTSTEGLDAAEDEADHYPVEEEEDTGEPEPLPLLGVEPSAGRQKDADERLEETAEEETPSDDLPLMTFDQPAEPVPPAVAPPTPAEASEVERAVLAGDRQALIDAYLALAARLESELETDRARDTLHRVLELDPANEQARAALTSVTTAASPPRDYIDLGELILAGTPEEVTRFQVAIGDPTGNEESDFAEILDLFRKKVSESLDPKDAASHYDLGLAFKQMGLLDDAIVHLQSGLRGGANPLATLEILGECFVLKGQVSLAARVFDRATRLDGVGDSDLVGVLYGLARCQEELGQLEEARGTYERIIAVDLAFRDAAQRLQHLQSR